MADATKQDIVTAVDIVQQQQLLEKEAWEALPGKFDKCTFSQGYIRQPLYACRTCSTGEDLAGMCYSCSMACHADHEVLELFPKRDFRCDCGLSDKFGGHHCELESGKREAKNKNAYSHNFLGRYCRCDQLYDPDKEDGVMYQCVVCEDWFHDRCIGEIPAAIAGFESFMCRQCTKRFPFLVNDDPHFHVGISKGDEKVHRWVQANLDVTETEKKRKAEKSSEDIATTKRQKADEGGLPSGIIDTCKNVMYETDDQVELFLDGGWREGLCCCGKCKHELARHSLEFLKHQETTFEPEDDEDAGKSLIDVGMEQLQAMDRVRALESIMAYKTLSIQVKEYLQTFKDSDKVVTEADIHLFFEKKRQEREQKTRS